MIQSLKKDIAKLSALAEGWDEGVSALERELFLDVLRRMYEKVRFADVQPTVESAPTVEQSLTETIAALAMSGVVESAVEEPDFEVELVMDEEVAIPVVAKSESAEGEEGDEPDFEVELVVEEDEEPMEEQSTLAVPFVEEQVEESSTEQSTPFEQPVEVAEPQAQPSEVDVNTSSKSVEKQENTIEAEPVTHSRPKISRQVIDTLYGDGALPKVTQSAQPQVVETQPTPMPAPQVVEVAAAPAPQEQATPQPVQPYVQPTAQPASTLPSVEPSVADVVTPKTVLGDVINTGAVRLGDSLQNDSIDVATKIAAGEVRSLRGAMGLNDKIMIMRDLFGGDAAQFDAVIDELDAQPSLDDALIYISGYAWNSASEGAKMLMNLLKLKFS
jgi:hypothetical protein